MQVLAPHLSPCSTAGCAHNSQEGTSTTPVSPLKPRMVMPVKARRGSQNNLNGVKRSHLHCQQVIVLSARGRPAALLDTNACLVGPAVKHAGNGRLLTGSACHSWRMDTERPGPIPEVHGPGPLQQDFVRPGLADLVHLEDGCQEQAQKRHVELVSCFACRVSFRGACSSCGLDAPSQRGHV